MPTDADIEEMDYDRERHEAIMRGEIPRDFDYNGEIASCERIIQSKDHQVMWVDPHLYRAVLLEAQAMRDTRTAQKEGP